MSKQEQGIDIESFNAVAESEAGHDFELKNADGTGTGVILTVIGKHADAVVAHTKNTFNRMYREEQMAKRRGKEVDLDIEKLNEQARQDAIVRVTGWKNVSQAFDKEMLRKALIRNPHWVEQILEESNNTGNFTKAN